LLYRYALLNRTEVRKASPVAAWRAGVQDRKQDESEDGEGPAARA